MSKLLEELLKQKRAQQEASEFAHIAVRREWISNCENLMSRITEWLQPLKAKNWLEIQSEDILLREDQLGDYETRSLRLIFLDSEILTFRPVGHFIIGARGRVDVVSGSTLLAMLLHKGNDEWDFARRKGRYGKPVRRAFNRSTLEEFLVKFLEE